MRAATPRLRTCQSGGAATSTAGGRRLRQTPPHELLQENLTDVKDSAPEFGFGEIGEAHFAMRELGAEMTGLAWNKLDPSERQAFSHTHEEAEEVCVILEGSGRLAVGPHHEGDGALNHAPGLWD